MKRIAIALLVAMLAFAVPATAFAGTLSPGDASALSAQGTGGLAKKDALNIALKDAGLKKTQVVEIELEKKKGTIEVEFTKKKTKAEYSYKISASIGRIIEKEVEYAYKHNASKAKIGEKAALKKVARFAGLKQSALKNAKCTYAYKKGEGKYTVKFRYNGYKYEYKLLAPTGKIIEWEKERIGA